MKHRILSKLHPAKRRAPLTREERYLRFAALVYVGLLIIAVLGDSSMLRRRLGSSIGTLSKILSMSAIGLVALKLLLFPNFNGLRRVVYYALLMGATILFALFLSIGIWIVELQDLSMMLKGCEKLMFQGINLLVVACAIFLFREKALDYTFYGLVGGNLLMAVITLPGYGLSDSIASVINCFTGGSEQSYGFMFAMEINDVTFAIGLFLAYYLVWGWKRPGNWLRIGAAGFFFLLGYKRIAFASLALAIGFGAVIKRTDEHSARAALLAVGLFVVALCYAYVVVIKEGIFTRFVTSMGIEMMGREGLFDIASRYCELSIFFLGHGMSTAGSFVELATGGELNAIHNDILVSYIEFGFVGFFIWYGFTFIGYPYLLWRHCNTDTAIVYMMCLLFMVITYMTDNTQWYYWDSMTLRLIPLAFSYYAKRPQRPPKRLRSPRYGWAGGY